MKFQFWGTLAVGIFLAALIAIFSPGGSESVQAPAEQSALETSAAPEQFAQEEPEASITNRLPIVPGLEKNQLVNGQTYVVFIGSHPAAGTYNAKTEIFVFEDGLSPVSVEDSEVNAYRNIESSQIKEGDHIVLCLNTGHGTWFKSTTSDFQTFVKSGCFWLTYLGITDNTTDVNWYRFLVDENSEWWIPWTGYIILDPTREE